MKFRLLTFVGLALAFAVQAAETPLRPPAVPLVTFDPYLSIWSPADHLAGAETVHWTKRIHPLTGLIRVDDKTFRVMGTQPANLPSFHQASLDVQPTRTIYEFEDAGIHLTLTFMRPALPWNLDDMALPVNYINWQAKSIDGRDHHVSIYQSAGAAITVNTPNQAVTWHGGKSGGLSILSVGTADQPVLGSSGDDHRIDWGYLYMAADDKQCHARAGFDQAMERAFVQTGNLPPGADTRMPRAASDQPCALACVSDLGAVSATPVNRTILVAYDELYAIKYFGRKLLPFWKRNGATAESMLAQAATDYPRLTEECAKFDAELMADLTQAGGEKYARMCALAYRQCAAACGLAADSNKQPLFFTKENTSNGDMATTDVFFPMDPQWILLSPNLTKASLVPILSYAASSHWKFPNAPHDLGTYPIANGTDDGGEGMPVEESGNMLILCDAVAHAEGNADFAGDWWPQLTQWAEYLQKFGLDPEDQLCTDDFMGHLAHNANLSIKAILGLASYGDLCRMRGDSKTAEVYFSLAKVDAAHWMKAATEGDHSRLAFDKPGTWSQKYNLAWDRILGLNVFPTQLARQEVAYYKARLETYGLPLDSRTKISKTDWTFWSASMADNSADFQSLTAPVYDYLNTTTARSPFADSYVTIDSHSDGMHARPVIGGIFMKMLNDPTLWTKWAGKDTSKAGPWAPLPTPPTISEIFPSARTSPVLWHYTTRRPVADWFKPQFNDTQWRQGYGSFGTSGTPGAVVRTSWNTSDIWLRREVKLPAELKPNLEFYVHHDEDIEIYVDGVLASKASGFTTTYVTLDILPRARALMHPGATIHLAVHCHQTEGGQNVDVALANVAE